MSDATTGRDACPLCDKPVMGRTALLGHLEFGHDIADPEPYLSQIEQPGGARRRSWPGGARRGLRAVGAVLAVGLLVAAGVLGYQQVLADDGADVAADGGADGTEPTGSASPATPTTEPEPTTTAPSTTAAPTTTTTTTTTATTTTEPPEDVAFRAPFLLDAETTGCTRQGGVDVHEFSFRFSGALNITFDGVFFPDDSGNGPRTSTHELPAGTSTYLDEVSVFDPSGGEHRVEISPPLYLGGC